MEPAVLRPGSCDIDMQRPVLHAPDVLFGWAMDPLEIEAAFEKVGRDPGAEHRRELRGPFIELVQHGHHLRGVAIPVTGYAAPDQRHEKKVEGKSAKVKTKWQGPFLGRGAAVCF